MAEKNFALEGLRGIAAVMVILSHCMFTFYPHMHICDVSLMKIPAERWLVKLPHTWYNGGFAVCVFFVMSGYVLTRKFFSDASSSLENAAVKRYIRLAIPVAASIFVAYGLMSYGLLGVNDPTLPGFINNFYHVPPVFEEAAMDGLWRALILGNPTYNYVLWTIQIEFIGSMSLFALLALFGRAKFSIVYAAVAVTLMYLFWPTEAAFFGMFLAGAYLHKLGDLGRSKIAHGAALVIGLYLGGYSCGPTYLTINAWDIFPAPVRAYGYMGLGALLLVWVATGPSAFSRILSSRPFAWLGNKSFSIYLLHTFVLSTVGIAVYHVCRPHGFILSTVLATLSTVGVSIVVSIPFERFVDRPAVALANAFGRWAMSRKSLANPARAQKGLKRS